MKKEMTILTEMRYTRSPMLYISEYCLSEMKAYTLYVAVNTDYCMWR